MRGKRKQEWVPESLVKQIERKMKERNFETRVQAMEEIAKELDRIIIKRRNKLK